MTSIDPIPGLTLGEDVADHLKQAISAFEVPASSAGSDIVAALEQVKASAVQLTVTIPSENLDLALSNLSTNVARLDYRYDYNECTMLLAQLAQKINILVTEAPKIEDLLTELVTLIEQAKEKADEVTNGLSRVNDAREGSIGISSDLQAKFSQAKNDAIGGPPQIGP